MSCLRRLDRAIRQAAGEFSLREIFEFCYRLRLLRRSLLLGLHTSLLQRTDLEGPARIPRSKLGFPIVRDINFVFFEA